MTWTSNRVSEVEAPASVLRVPLEIAVLLDLL
jgi:hypothetical protein